MIGFLSGFPVAGLFAVAALVLAMESGVLVGLFLPGSSLLLALGFLARHGVVNPWVVVLVAGSASALGCQFGFWRARRHRLLDPAAGSADLLDPPNRVERKLIDRAGRARVRRILSFLDRRAVPTVAVCQFLSLVRTLMPRLAGRAGVSRRRFSLANVPMAFAWAALVSTLGRLAGEAYERVETALGLAGPPVVLAVALLAWVTFKIRRRAGAGAAEPASEPAP